MRIRLLVAPFAVSALCCTPSGAAQLTATTGLEFTTGDYGKTSSTQEWRLALGLRYANGPWTLRASAPLSRVQGVATAIERETRVATADLNGDGVIDDDDDDEEEESGAAGAVGTGGAELVPTGRSDAGFGDGVLSASYALLDAKAGSVGLDLGGRVKLPLTSASNCFLTNGEVDYSAEATLYKPIGRIEPSITWGWTLRGDPQRRDINCNPVPGQEVNLRNPFYAVLGLGLPLGRGWSSELRYLYREKLRDSADPLKELRFNATYRLTEVWRLGMYALAGFTDASPAWGFGASIGYRF
jgi:hypothetical protein